VKKLSLPNSAYITNTFDSVARMLSTTLKNSGNTNLNSHQYIYNPGNQRTNMMRTDGSFVDYTYDPGGQLKTVLGKESGGTTNRWNEQFRYTYDAAGNLSNRVQNVLTNVFNVNSLNELTSVVRTNSNLTVGGNYVGAATNVTVADNGNSPPVQADRYADGTFARTNVTLLNGTNTFVAVAKDADSRADTNTAVSYLPTAAIFAYDLNGNMITNGGVVLAYDDENQLATITNAGAWASTFTYDGKMRRRIRKEYVWRSGAWVKTEEMHYVYDRNVVLQERDQFNVATKTFTRGVDLSGSMQGAGGIGGLLALSQLSTIAPQHNYYHADGNGNVTMLIDLNQAVVARYIYEPYGNTLSATGPMAEENLYRFSSKETHTSSALTYFGRRFSVPSLQRWLNRDPLGEPGFELLLGRKANVIGDGANLYAFVHNNPVTQIDPLGLNAEETAAILQASLGAFRSLCDNDRHCNCPSGGNAWNFVTLGQTSWQGCVSQSKAAEEALAKLPFVDTFGGSYSMKWHYEWDVFGPGPILPHNWISLNPNSAYLERDPAFIIDLHQGWIRVIYMDYTFVIHLKCDPLSITGEYVPRDLPPLPTP